MGVKVFCLIKLPSSSQAFSYIQAYLKSVADTPASMTADPVREEQEFLDALVQRVADLQQHHAAHPCEDDQQQATFSALATTGKMQVLSNVLQEQGQARQQDVRVEG